MRVPFLSTFYFKLLAQKKSLYPAFFYTNLLIIILSFFIIIIIIILIAFIITFLLLFLIFIIIFIAAHYVFIYRHFLLSHVLELFSDTITCLGWSSDYYFQWAPFDYEAKEIRDVGSLVN